ncbi:MAG: PKD domain-containing protein [Methanospirillaceae archaeon]|nr:PKD domain-containing protein [Methanospirillaceae archaeon]
MKHILLQSYAGIFIAILILIPAGTISATGDSPGGGLAPDTSGIPAVTGGEDYAGDLYYRYLAEKEEGQEITGVAGSGTLHKTPINPHLIAYLAGASDIHAQEGPEEGSFGYIPGPVDLSYLDGIKLFSSPGSVIASDSLPSGFSLRTEGRVTSVKNQGSCGSCWAFATMGSMESNLMPEETLDLSEDNLKTHKLYDWAQCQGGNAFISLAYFTRWNGPVYESDDPYTAGASAVLTLPPRRHVQEVLVIPNKPYPLTNVADLDDIKKAVMDYGGVMTLMYATGDWYWYTGSSLPNHAVVIVGWDDSYHRSGYSSDGAFLMRNSWGSSWGDGGYFWASYYDKYIGTDNFVFSNAEPVENYDNIYSHDPLGWTGNIGYQSHTGWFSNVFTATGSQQIKGVGFICGEAGGSQLLQEEGEIRVAALPESPYEIFIYRGCTTGNPRSGTLVSQTSGTITVPGYHTIPVPPVTVSAGETFSVVIRLTYPLSTEPIPVEDRISGVTSAASSLAGQSYISPDGAVWTDLKSTSLCPHANVCIKAYSEDYTPILADFLFWPAQGVAPLKVYFVDTSSGVSPGASYQWDLDGDGITDYTGSGQVNYTYLSPGEYTVNLTISSLDETVSVTKSL